MFNKLSLLTLATPLTVSALIIAAPHHPTSGGVVTITWTNQSGDPPTWSFELAEAIFNHDYAIANNVNPSSGSLTVTFPMVPISDVYAIRAVNIGNRNDIFAQSPDFFIGGHILSAAS